MANIIVFGGSNVYGVWDREGGWVQRLRSYLEDASAASSEIGRHYLSYLVYNLGVPSSNSKSILERVQFELRKRMGADEESVVVFDIGKNDSSVLGKKGDFNILPTVFAKNIKEIYGLTKIFTSRIVFLALLPVDEAKTNPVYWNQNLVYKNQYAEKYNAAIRDLCEQTGSLFIDVYSIFKTHPQWQNYFEDGLHLNKKGYRLVFEIVKDTLIQNKFIELKKEKPIT